MIDNKAQSGYCNIIILPQDQSGAYYIYLWGAIPNIYHTTGSLNIATSPYVWGRNDSGKSLYVWNTGALYPSGIHTPAYPAGTYIVFIESTLNNMKNNYRDGTEVYLGKTQSVPTTITLVSDTVSITANKDTVVRTKPFSVTVVGRPSAFYNVWIKSTNTMKLAEYDNAAPVVTAFQDNVVPGSPITDAYLYQNGGGKNVTQDSYGDGANCAYARIHAALLVPEPLSSLPLQTPKHRSPPSVLKQTPMDLALVTPRLITRTANLRETKSM